MKYSLTQGRWHSVFIQHNMQMTGHHVKNIALESILLSCTGPVQMISH